MADLPKPKRLPGCIYRNGNRWWWKVRLPGEDRIRARPLKPYGAKWATKDEIVAREVARQMYAHALATSRTQHRDWDGTVGRLARMYMAYAREYYRPPSSEAERVRQALLPLLRLYEDLPAEDFGPLALQEVRQAMIEAGLARVTINQRIGVVKRMFKWAVSRQLVPAGALAALQAVDGLRRGRSPARESQPVRAIDERWVRMTMQVMPPTLAAMVEIQMLTGMRSGELVIMRPCDVDTTGKVWTYTPATHKTAYRGHSRVVPIGPKAQRVLAPFLARPLEAYCFSPDQAERERAVGRNGRGGQRYDVSSYRRAITYAIERARREVDPDIPDWHPHQLRHTAATIIRREFGLDAARAVLGQKSLAIADTYAELDRALAIRTAEKLG